jgi:hypothetical protein
MAVIEGVPEVIAYDPKRLSKQQQAELDDALAALIASTRRARRKLNLIDIGQKLSIARRYMESLEAVSSAVGLSPEMLRQFARVEALCPSVRALIKEGGIRSVEIADRISRLPTEDQLYVAEKVARGELNSSDVRAVLAHRKTAPSLPIYRVVRDVLASKNTREYLIEFRIPKHADKNTVQSRLELFFGEDAIYDIKARGATGDACLTEAGRRHLEDAAKKKRLTKRQMVDIVISGETQDEQ